MANVNPLLLVGAVIGVVTALLVFAYASVRTRKDPWALNGIWPMARSSAV